MTIVSFSEFISHLNGTYAAVIPNQEDANDLYDFMKDKNIKGELVPASKYHITYCYSRRPCPKAEGMNFEACMPFNVYPMRFETFGEHLVLLVKSLELNIMHNRLREAGASFDYGMYRPHITVAKKFKGFKQFLHVPKGPIEIVGNVIKPLEVE